MLRHLSAEDKTLYINTEQVVRIRPQRDGSAYLYLSDGSTVVATPEELDSIMKDVKYL